MSRGEKMPGKDGFGSLSGGMGKRQGNRKGAGPSGNCICPKCGTKIAHQRGVPCYQTKCPQCETQMVRE